jgi:hypothetical protein
MQNSYCEHRNFDSVSQTLVRRLSFISESVINRQKIIYNIQHARYADRDIDE